MNSSEAAKSVLGPYLAPGESLLWSGMPEPRRIATLESSTLFQFVIPGVLAVIVAAFLPPAYTFADWLLRAALVLFFPLVGVVAFSYELWLHSATCYALTTRRLLIFSGNQGYLYESPLATLEPWYSEEPDGSGTVTFEGARWYSGNRSGTPAIERIAQVRTVYDICNRAIAATRDVPGTA